MSRNHDLTGLMKYLERDDWHNCFEEIFGNHFDTVLEEADMEFEDLAEVLGEHWAMTLWGCAFEDFLTQEFDVEGVNIIDSYLKRRGWKENAQAKAYMKALRTSVMSLYEVSDVVPGKSLMARDLVRGGEPILVSEGSATRTLKQWDRLAARIVPVFGKNVLAGGILSFTPEASEELFDSLRHMFGNADSKKMPVIKDEDLQAVAFIFTVTWLFDTLDRATVQPSIRNSDGDDLLFHEIRFPLASGDGQKNIVAILDAVPGISREAANVWNWFDETPTSGGKSRQSDGVAFDVNTDSGLRVLGTVELTDRYLRFSVNSAARAERATTLIRNALADLVGTPLTEIRTVEQVMADRADGGEGGVAPNVPPEIAEQIVHEVLDRQYRETLDQPVPALGNKTPRQAVKSSAGRAKVAEWLKYLENRSANQSDPADPVATYSFEWMWKELGVLDLRR